MVLTGREKSTILLSILGADFASRVLRYLPDEMADIIAAGINHLPSPSPEALGEVLRDFQSFLALPKPAAAPSSLPPRPAAPPKKSYAFLMYERPQIAAFIISLLPGEDRADALNSLSRDKALVEELVNNLKTHPLRPKIEAKMRQAFTGKVF